MEGIEEPPDVSEKDDKFLGKLWANIDSLPPADNWFADKANELRKQEEIDNAIIDGLELSNVDSEPRNASGEWTAGKAAKKSAHDTAKKQARQAYVAGRMQHDARTAPGLVTVGNVNLLNRPQVPNADGSISTVRSMSINIDGKEVLIPTVSAIQNRVLTDEEAIAEYRQTGQHLGVFNSPQAATQYANRLHKHQEEFYSD